MRKIFLIVLAAITFFLFTGCRNSKTAKNEFFTMDSIDSCSVSSSISECTITGEDAEYLYNIFKELELTEHGEPEQLYGGNTVTFKKGDKEESVTLQNGTFIAVGEKRYDTGKDITETVLNMREKHKDDIKYYEETE